MTAAALQFPGANEATGLSLFIQRIVDQIADAVAARMLPRLRESAGEPRIAPRWLDLDGAAQLMNTTKGTVRGMARAKLFPVKKMGGRVMVDVRDIEKAFAENTAWL